MFYQIQRSVIFAAAVCAYICLYSASASVEDADFFVAPDGNDSWSGKYEHANQDKTDGPFATLEKARNAVRELRTMPHKHNKPIHVCLLEGNYVLNKTFRLTDKDSGTQQAPVIYAAAPGKEVIISGGQKVKSWKPYREKIMQSDLRSQGFADTVVGLLYYKGICQHSARVPNFDRKNPLYGGFAYTADDVNEPNATKIKYDPSVIQPQRWNEYGKAVLDIFPGYNYGNRRVKIKGADAKNNILHFEKLDYRPVKGDRFFVENIFEELDAAGEWYFNDISGILYFWPQDDDLTDYGALVPVVDTLVEFNGAHDIELKGLSLRYCIKTAISMQDTEKCLIAGCTISDTGEKGIELLPQCRNNRIISNDIMRTGDYAVFLTAPLFEHSKCSINVIFNNNIYNMGTVLKEVAGIGILGGGENTVSHNKIHDGPRWGVFINSGARNIIEYNHIYNMSLETEDTGAIYMGTAHGGWIPNLDIEKNKLHRGNVLRYNLIHDTLGYGMTGWWNTTKGTWTKPYYSWSIYLDLGASGTHIYGNICYNSHLGGLMFGTLDNVAENNIFVDGEVVQVGTIKWEPPTPKPEIAIHFPSAGNRVERNIISYSKPGSYLYWFVYQYGSKWEPNEFYFNNNIIHYSGGQIKLQAAGIENEHQWQGWLRRGMDVNSIICDPMFVNADKHDYRLKDNSPAFKIGFKPIPVEKIGLYADEYRKVDSVHREDKK